MDTKRVLFFLRICLLVTTAKLLHNINVRPFWFNRTEDQQAGLYDIGRTKELERRPVTNFDGFIKKSKHQFWLAIDLVIVIEGLLIWERIEAYELLGKLAQKFGLRWGGDWDSDEIIEPTENDIYHFEYKGE